MRAARSGVKDMVDRLAFWGFATLLLLQCRRGRWASAPGRLILISTYDNVMAQTGRTLLRVSSGILRTATFLGREGLIERGGLRLALRMAILLQRIALPLMRTRLRRRHRSRVRRGGVRELDGRSPSAFSG